MTTEPNEKGAEFQRGWDAAILAARRWHEGKAQQAIVQSRRTRFPKALERESEVHRHSAEMMMTLESRRRMNTTGTKGETEKPDAPRTTEVGG